MKKDGFHEKIVSSKFVDAFEANCFNNISFVSRIDLMQNGNFYFLSRFL